MIVICLFYSIFFQLRSRPNSFSPIQTKLMTPTYPSIEEKLESARGGSRPPQGAKVDSPATSISPGAPRLLPHAYEVGSPDVLLVDRTGSFGPAAFFRFPKKSPSLLRTFSDGATGPLGLPWAAPQGPPDPWATALQAVNPSARRTPHGAPALALSPEPLPGFRVNQPIFKLRIPSASKLLRTASGQTPAPPCATATLSPGPDVTIPAVLPSPPNRVAIAHRASLLSRMIVRPVALFRDLCAAWSSGEKQRRKRTQGHARGTSQSPSASASPSPGRTGAGTPSPAYRTPKHKRPRAAESEEREESPRVCLEDGRRARDGCTE